MIPYSLHVALILSVCVAFYKVLLQKETYYRLNRVVLLACLALAFLLPLVPVPQRFSLRGGVPVITRDASPITAEAVGEPENKGAGDNVIGSPVRAIPVAEQGVAQQVATKPLPPAVPVMATLIKWAFLIYWCGIGVFGINLLLQVAALIYQAYKKPFMQDGIFRIVELDDDKAPCSFGKSIFINPAKYDWETYNQILMHEKVHIQQGHSLDLLLAELMLVVQWFNPFAWIYRRDLESNLEFLTDDEVLHKNKVEPADYQMSLLKVSVPNFSMRITTNYNQSLLKKRIVMMNAKKSNIHTMWKYFMLMPLLLALVCGLNKPIAMSSPVAKFQQGISFKRGDKVSIDFSHGTWYATVKGEKINIEFQADENDENHSWSSGSTFNLADFPALPKTEKADFALTREAGQLVMNGKFDGDQGIGHYKFTPNKDYQAFMAKMDLQGSDDDIYFSFFMHNVKKDYVQFLKENFKDISRGQVMSMAYQNIDAGYIRYWKKLGYVSLEPMQLVSLKSLRVDSAYVNEIRRAGYTDLTIRQIISFKQQHITGDYINSLAKATVKVPGKTATEAKPTAQEIITSKFMHVDSAYVAGTRKAGYGDLTYTQMGALKSRDISPAYIESFDVVGYKNIPYSTLMSMKSMDITPEYVKGFKDEGYTDEDIQRLVQMKREGITPEYIKSFAAVGYKVLPLNTLYSFKSLKITPEYIKGFQDLGYKDLPLNNYATFKLRGVMPEMIKGFQDVGYKDISPNDLFFLKSITPDYIKSFQALGYKDVSFSQYNSLKRQGITADYVAGFNKLGFNNIPVNQLNYLKMTGITPEFISEMKQKGFESKDLNKYIQLKNFNNTTANGTPGIRTMKAIVTDAGTNH